MSTTILMCEPEYFGVDYEINPWMAGNIGKVDKQLAYMQWHNLVSIISTLATVKLVEPVYGLPDMVFTANAALVINDAVILSRFRNKQRTGEESYMSNWFNKNDYYVFTPEAYMTFEGAGDCLMSGNSTAWMGFGFRSSENATEYVASILDIYSGIRTTILRLVDDRFYHLDTCFCPLSNGYLLYFPAAFDDASCQLITNHFGDRAIVVDEADAINFACNAVNIENVIIVNKVSDKFKCDVHDAGFIVVETPMSEFMKSGGSAKCLTLKI